MANYTFTSSDISAIAAAGVTALFKGATLKAGDVYGAGNQEGGRYRRGLRNTTASGAHRGAARRAQGRSADRPHERAGGG